MIIKTKGKGQILNKTERRKGGADSVALLKSLRLYHTAKNSEPLKVYLEKLIFTAFRLEGYIPTGKELEEVEDVVQDFRYHAWRLATKKLNPWATWSVKFEKPLTTEDKTNLITRLNLEKYEKNQQKVTIFQYHVAKPVTLMNNISYNRQVMPSTYLNKKFHNYLSVSLRLRVRLKLKQNYNKIAQRETIKGYIQSSLELCNTSTIDQHLIEPFAGTFNNGTLEHSVAVYLANGYTKKEVAKLLCLDQKTLKKTMQSIQDRLRPMV